MDLEPKSSRYTKNNLLSLALDTEFLVEVHLPDPWATNHRSHMFQKGFVVHHSFGLQFLEGNFDLFMID